MLRKALIYLLGAVLLIPVGGSFLIALSLMLRLMGDEPAALVTKRIVVGLAAIWGLHTIGLLLTVAAATLARMDKDPPSD